MSPRESDAGPYRADTRTESTEPRADRGREWEVFVRETTDDPLRHVGSVTAGDAAGAETRAASLFDWSAVAIWVCPADEVGRFDARELADRDDASPADDATDDATATEPEGRP